MAQGQIRTALKINLITFIPGLVMLAEHAFGSGNGADKKAQVQSDLMALGHAFAGLGLQVVSANNPAYSQLIDAVAQELFADHSHPPVVVPPPVDPLPPPTVDPTTVEYDTLDEAKAAATANPSYPFVIEKANGKFVIWPTVGPFPGTKVWPPE